jgi:hypothetical protein
MIGNSLLLLVASVALAQTGGSTQPSDGIPTEGTQIMSGTATLGGKVLVRYKTTITTAASHPHGFGGGVKTDRTGMHRWLLRTKDGSYIGYDLVLGPGDAVDGFQISFQPVTDVDDMLQRASQGAALTPMPLPKYPAPQIVHDGDTVVLDLMASADGTEKLTDYIQFFAELPEPKAAATTAAARDFTLDDGPVHFQFAESRFFVGGKQYSGNVNFQQARAGLTFWFAVPNQGRYVLSLLPHDGFTQSGEVRDNAIRFGDAGQQYELRTMDNIIGAGGAFHLYMRHDPTYQPKPGRENTVTVGMDRLENLLPNQ